MRAPAREVGWPGAHRDRCIDARTAPEHLAAKRRHVVTESEMILGMVTPVVCLITSDAVRVRDHVRIFRRRVGLAGLQQENTPRAILAQAVREHGACGSAAHDDDIGRFGLVGHETFPFSDG